MHLSKFPRRSASVVSSYKVRRLARKQLKVAYKSLCAVNRLVRDYAVSSREVLSSSHAESSTSKVYAPNIEKMVQDISQLTCLEVAELNELLKKTLNIQNAPMMAVGSVAAPAAMEEEEEEEEALRQEQMTFTVKLTKFNDGKKVELIKAIKGLVPNVNLVQAKKLVECCPLVVESDLSKDEAEKMKGELEAAGGEVEIE